MTPVTFFVLFTSIVQKLQALNQYTLNKVLKAAGSKCRIFILQHYSFDHCITQTRHTSALFNNNEYPMSVTQLISGGLQKDWLSTGYMGKLYVEILLILNHFNLSLHFPSRSLFFVVCKKYSAFCLFLFYTENKMQHQNATPLIRLDLALKHCCCMQGIYLPNNSALQL